MKIGIYCGHGESDNGGYDPGAVNPRLGLHETKIAREIAKFTVEELMNYNCKVFLINYAGDMTLNERINHANENDYDAIIEVHLNAHTSNAYGTEAYYYNGDVVGRNLADSICLEISKALNVVQRSNGVDDGGDKPTTYFGIVCRTKPTAVLVETCFISTDSEVKKVDELHEQKVAGIAIAQGIAKAYSLTKKQEEVKEKIKVHYIEVGGFTDRNNPKLKVIEDMCKAFGMYCRILKR